MMWNALQTDSIQDRGKGRYLIVSFGCNLLLDALRSHFVILHTLEQPSSLSFRLIALHCNNSRVRSNVIRWEYSCNLNKQTHELVWATRDTYPLKSDVGGVNLPAYLSYKHYIR